MSKSDTDSRQAIPITSRRFGIDGKKGLPCEFFVGEVFHQRAPDAVLPVTGADDGHRLRVEELASANSIGAVGRMILAVYLFSTGYRTSRHSFHPPLST